MFIILIILLGFIAISLFIVNIRTKQKNNLINTFMKIAIIFFIILLSIFAATDYIMETLDEKKYSNEYEENYYEDFSQRGSMIGTGDDGLSVTPIDAYLQNGKIYVECNLTNNTKNNLKIRDFGKVTANGIVVPYATDFEDSLQLNKGEEKKVIFEFGAYDVMASKKDFPNYIAIDLGTTISNGNYLEYDISFTIAWLYNYSY